jgi:hypothetical protein
LQYKFHQTVPKICNEKIFERKSLQRLKIINQDFFLEKKISPASATETQIWNIYVQTFSGGGSQRLWTAASPEAPTADVFGAQSWFVHDRRRKNSYGPEGPLSEAHRRVQSPRPFHSALHEFVLPAR